MTRAASQEQRWDRERDLRKHEPRPSDDRRLNDHHRIMHVSYLTAYLDTLLRVGAIPPDLRDGIRSTVDRTRVAFGLPELGSRGPM